MANIREGELNPHQSVEGNRRM